ncbi:MAG: polyribonucleotide nucleotidyltransferase [Bacteroidia bacterium]|nr:polyribonucleotide nucleotidyltransferase [Bacteroidia bacterium]
MNIIQKSLTLPDGRVIQIETGKMARQADGAITLRCGETLLLATVVAKREINLETDFLPLSVDYFEKYSSSGRFPGGFFKRDGRMGENEVLVCRLIDRALRPLFPDNYHADTQIMVQLMSSDREEQPDALGCLAASAALMVSDIPFQDPVSEVRVTRKNGTFYINPGFSQMEGTDLDLMVAATNDSIVMVEGEMVEVSEEVMLEAIKFAHESIKTLNNLQLELRAAVGKATREYAHLEEKPELEAELKALVQEDLYKVARGKMSKQERQEIISKAYDNAKTVLTEKYGETVEYLSTYIKGSFKHIQSDIVREVVVKEGIRLDGRSTTDVRQIDSEVAFLPRTHGSALFTRGETQSLCAVTLGTKLDQQTIDSATFIGSKTFMLQYNFPGFSTGEVKPNRAPARREIGHGNLAERSLKVMIPESPYTIRVESNILESNGSSSMASVCGGTLALMDAGIQIIRPVSGIAMGLITMSDNSFAVLSDILGDEDHLGDMDFKVAGTEKGLTACQMDIKIRGLSYEIIQKALAQSKNGRMHILREMLKAIDKPRSELSPFAPRFFVMSIPHEYFGAVIGPGGKVIQEIQKTTETVIVLEEGPNSVGTATISSSNAKGIEMAVAQIRNIVQIPEIGETYTGKVRSIQAFGAFVEFLPGKDGLVHISEIANEKVDKVENYLKLGDEVNVKLLDIDPKSGKFRLSIKALLPKK